MEENTPIEKKLKLLLEKLLGESIKEIEVKKEPETLHSIKLVVLLRGIDPYITIEENYEKFIEELMKMEDNDELEIYTYAIYSCVRTIHPENFTIVEGDETYDTLEEIVMEITIYGENSLKKFERLVDKFLLSYI